ncbi:hypothetical protein SGB_02391 [Shigella boydii ATCC 9905]|nr:hypothetical protein SGB_02391 [Shigella boydii ATCC 9905]
MLCKQTVTIAQMIKGHSLESMLSIVMNNHHSKSGGMPV